MAEEVQIARSSQPWNPAQIFSYEKIMKPLALFDKLIRIAKYGYEDIEDKYNFLPEQIVFNRIEALTRLKDELLLIIGNSKFMMNKSNLDKISEFKSKIIAVEEKLDGIFTVCADQTRKNEKTIIDENVFKLALKVLTEIVEDINTPLNDASLIFPSSDEIDLDKIEHKLINGG